MNTPADPRSAQPAIPTPYPGASQVKPEWLDSNGHMNVAHYVSAFDDGSCPMFDYLGLGWDYTELGESSVFMASSSIDFRRELLAGDRLRMESYLVGYDTRRIHIYQELFHHDHAYLAAQAEFVFVHVSLKTRRSTPIPEPAMGRLAAIHAAHSSVKLPGFVGRSIGLEWKPAK